MITLLANSKAMPTSHRLFLSDGMKLDLSSYCVVVPRQHSGSSVL